VFVDVPYSRLGLVFKTTGGTLSVERPRRRWPDWTMDIKVLPCSLSKRGCKVASDQNIKCFTRRLGE